MVNWVLNTLKHQVRCCSLACRCHEGQAEIGATYPECLLDTHKFLTPSGIWELRGASSVPANLIKCSVPVGLFMLTFFRSWHKLLVSHLQYSCRASFVTVIQVRMEKM